YLYPMSKKPIQEMRAFNRWYTDVIGLLNRNLLDSEYSLAEGRLIYELHKAGSVQASQIMTTMHIDKSYLSRTLKKLENEKIVARRKSPHDRRAVQLSLTKKGMREFAMLNAASDEQIGSLVGHLREEQREQLVTHMNAIRRLMAPPPRPIAVEDPHAPVSDSPRPAVNPKTIAIRTTLKPGDLGYIAYMHGRVYNREHQYGLGFESYVLQGLGEFGHHYDPRKDRVWICEYGQEMVGFLVGVHRKDAVQLRYFILLPEYRGLGLGKRLMKEFMAYVHDSGHRRAYLWTTNEQQAAIALYTQYGFVLREEKESRAFDKPLIELKYELTL
ncbi:MAG TPA: helix-turn-helix domain-containing GNAT family N-acetyltransferase, partial [Puia sp.]|nr:helix-turn-helix domain-containing GNAT family N-acetyltransferase [Puia sp.]